VVVNVRLRTLIRDMVVRGAPAIGVSAALSMAVELVNHAPFGSAKDVEDYTHFALDYLVTRCACNNYAHPDVPEGTRYPIRSRLAIKCCVS
jgi:methylthioribose-1-phosphate isomerase